MLISLGLAYLIRLTVISPNSVVFQDSWHSLVDFYAASFAGVSGFNVTGPIAV